MSSPTLQTGRGWSQLVCLSGSFLGSCWRGWGDSWRCCESYVSVLIDVWGTPSGYISPLLSSPGISLLVSIVTFSSCFINPKSFLCDRQTGGILHTWSLNVDMFRLHVLDLNFRNLQYFSGTLVLISIVVVCLVLRILIQSNTLVWLHINKVTNLCASSVFCYMSETGWRPIAVRGLTGEMTTPDWPGSSRTRGSCQRQGGLGISASLCATITLMN